MMNHDKTTIQLEKLTLEDLNALKFKLQARIIRNVSHDKLIAALVDSAVIDTLIKMLEKNEKNSN